jgi:hypothetical protein
MDIEVLIRRKEDKPTEEEERRRVIDTMLGPDRIHFSSHTVSEEQLQELLRYIAEH